MRAMEEANIKIQNSVAMPLEMFLDSNQLHSLINNMEKTAERATGIRNSLPKYSPPKLSKKNNRTYTLR